ncbi:MAG TPA: ATP synthase F1 subunit gamma [Bacteroidales bacterium]|nr:ATP synthase F1 subunit gamma [Bacteroidales bacterium]MDI9573938.1 ATP synthase F1 subunit gamma [Bacteroidota bacterium]MBP9512053.1 ATP synthase F1 subunit gamma [Bacteroidales bacterium]MBP9588536.1 ATP synthase F1 subunit gamma [Bacteroidales bacterium]NMD15239.1 ATP synthase F1 subunit gamma [Bacteroidales bacterium]
MSNLKEVRLRIESVKNTQQITNAMKMVAASKLRKAQNAILSLRPYAQKMSELISTLYSNYSENLSSPFFEQHETDKVLLVSLASNRGLCGAFNSNIIKQIKYLTETSFEQQYGLNHLKLISIGKHVSDILINKKYPVLQIKDNLIEKVTWEGVKLLADELIELWTKHEFDRIVLVYNQFINAATQVVTTETFLPLSYDENKKTRNIDYIFEPSSETIIEELIPHYLHIQLYKTFLDSFASEQGARMTAMMIATDNADVILKDLTLSYNKARQAAITKEILEIVSGSNALNKV